MTYFDEVYKKRGKWWGETSKDQYLNIAKQYFNDYLLNSPNADSVTINGEEMTAVVSDNSDDENKITKYFLFDLSVPIEQGNLITWYGDSWIVLRKEKRSFEAYNKVLALRCNHTLKWVDDYGVLQETPAHILGTMSGRVEDNFRIASNLLVMPQANKNLKIVLPYHSIMSEQRFIINGEAWRVLERDLSSVNGVLYLYLLEDLVDSNSDSVEEDIANANKLNSSKIEIGLDALSIEVGNHFTFSPVFFNGGKIEEVDFSISTTNSEILSINNYTVSALAKGSAEIIFSLVSNPSVKTICHVEVVDIAEDLNILQIVGAENIKWGATRTYTVLYGGSSIPSEIPATFEVFNNELSLVSLKSSTEGSCTLTANSDGRLGTIVLRATTDFGTVDKNIDVLSIWG